MCRPHRPCTKVARMSWHPRRHAAPLAGTQASHGQWPRHRARWQEFQLQ